MLPGYLKQELAARGLPDEAGAELLAIIDSPANREFLQGASLDAAYGFIQSWGAEIDRQLPTLQTRWAQGNRQEARANGDHWRPTGGGGGGNGPATPNTMAETSAAGLADFLSKFGE